MWRLPAWAHGVQLRRLLMNIRRFRVAPGAAIDLRRCDPADTGPYTSKEHALDRLQKGIDRLIDLQQRLYAQDRWAVLLIFQGLDAAGKDGTIRHVMSGLNPLGTQVFSFRQPSSEELDHDFLWRTFNALPERGRIGIFNRSHYEEALVVRVHPEILAAQKIPASLVSTNIWTERFEDINAVEKYLSRNGVLIRKFFLHVSKAEQRRRLAERLDDPSKNWKFSSTDLEGRAKWGAYVRAYEEVLSATSRKHAPWYVIPADHKWFAHLLVAEVMIDALESLDLRFPSVTSAQRDVLAQARRRLRV
jgi:PPK2 family polyphosphate:nucleotide phosphotransferase